MSKNAIFAAAFLVASVTPAFAQGSDDAIREEHRRHSAMQHIGGHYRHGHRDWSGSEGRGHTHNVCWEWDGALGWQWTCGSGN